MPTKRQLLEALNSSELLAVAEQYELEVADRRVREHLLDDAAASRKVAPADVLADYPRDRLKELCRELDLDDSGREKGTLVERLTDQAAKEPSPNSKSSKNGRANESKLNGAAVAVVPGETLTQAKLEGYLWSAADILRGSIDSSDYKSLFFGLLFLKRLSDRGPGHGGRKLGPARPAHAGLRCKA